MNGSSGPKPALNKAIVILGMHGSGTSVVAGLLAQLGVATGKRLLPDQAGTNGKGCWEHKDVVRINEELLLALGSSWHDSRPLAPDWWRLDSVSSYRAQLRAALAWDFSSAPLWLVSDPRICRLLPLWRDLFAEIGAEPRFLLDLGHPIESARLLAKRDGIPPERASLLWLTYTLAAELGSRGLPRTFLAYDSLRDDWRREVRRLEAELAVALSLGQADQEARAATLIEPSLRHHRDQEDDPASAPMTALAIRCYRLLVSAPAAEILSSELGQIQREVDQAIAAYAPWEGQIQEAAAIRRDLEGRLDAARRISETTIANLDEEIRMLKQSASWRYTKPLRVRSAIRRLFGHGDRHKYEYRVDLNNDNSVPPKVVRMVGNDRRVLEVGAGPGTITRLLKEHGRCRVTAIEIDDEAITKLTPFCENVFRCDLNDVDWVWQVSAEGPFQVVVVADVLEHLGNPSSVLRAVTALLGQDGELVVSLPHVGHSAVLASIAGEDFDYHNWGLLDRTHIKFFGMKNIQSLLNDTGYKIVAAEFVVKHPTDTEFAQAWLRATPELKRALATNPFGSVYQVVLKAQLDPTGEKGLDLLSMPVPSAASAWRDWASS